MNKTISALFGTVVGLILALILDYSRRVINFSFHKEPGFGPESTIRDGLAWNWTWADLGHMVFHL